MSRFLRLLLLGLVCLASLLVGAFPRAHAAESDEDASLIANNEYIPDALFGDEGGLLIDEPAASDAAPLGAADPSSEPLDVGSEAYVSATIPEVPPDDADAETEEVEETGSTARVSTMHVEMLPASPDESGRQQPVLISIVDRATLTVSAGEQVVLGEDFEPLWYHLLRDRDFADMEWSGCGGKWRPEWSAQREAEGEGEGEGEDSDAGGFRRLKHFLAHHAVCAASSVSMCAADHRARPAQGREALNFADPNAHFQWGASFISALTSSPLSFTTDTPRHARPSGVVFVTEADAGTAGSAALRREAHVEAGAVGRSAAHTAASRASPAEKIREGESGKEGVAAAGSMPVAEVCGSAGPPMRSWCSYHVVHHDTLCTQQMSPLLQHAKYHKGLRMESRSGLPQDLIFNNVIASLFDFLATPFHHFHFTARWRPTDAAGGARVEVLTRMSFVVTSVEHQARLAEHWSHSLRASRHSTPPLSRELLRRLTIYVGPGGLPPHMRAVLPAKRVRLDLSQPAAHATARRSSTASLPEVSYEIRSVGKDHGYYSVYLHPASTLVSQGQAVDSAGVARPLQVGDEVTLLAFFPLHLLRPRLYNMESLLGSSVIENVHVDKDSNTMAVLVRTILTDAHVHAFESTYTDPAAARRGGGGGQKRGRTADTRPLLLLARFQFHHGWGGLKDVPRDANRYSIVPQPVLRIVRHVTPGEAERVPSAPAVCAKVCGQLGLDATVGAPPNGAVSVDHTESIPLVDHQSSLLRMMQALGAASFAPTAEGAARAAEEGSCACHRLLRSTVSAGSLLPGPDAAMVFNVLSLGLTFAALAVSTFFRSLRNLGCRREYLLYEEKGFVTQ